MQLKGNQVVKAVPSCIWKILMEPNSLVKLVPGLSQLEKLAENSYKATFDIKVGPVSSNFSGELELMDIREEKSFALKTLQHSKIGKAHADVLINLVPLDDDRTEVMFKGNVKLSGMLATMGQRLVGGVANTLTGQFFDNLQNELAIKPGLRG